MGERPISEPHERIWFRGRQKAAVDVLPSAVAQDGAAVRAAGRRPARFRRLPLMVRVAGVLAGAVVLIAAFIAGSLIMLASGDRMTVLARTQLAQLAGDGYGAGIGSVRLRLFDDSLASVAVSEVKLRDSASGAIVFEADELRFAVTEAGLLAGRLNLGAVSIEGARLVLAAAGGNDGELLLTLLGPDGLIDPAKVKSELDRAAGRLAALLARYPDLVVSATNSRIDTPGIAGGRISVSSLLGGRAADGRFALEAGIGGETWNTTLSLVIEGDVGQPSFQARLAPLSFRHEFADQVTPEKLPRSCEGKIGVELASGAGSVAVDARFAEVKCDAAALGAYAMEGIVSGSIRDGHGVFDISRGEVTVNRSKFLFGGAIAPARNTPLPSGPDEAAQYRYEVVLEPSTLDPLDNAEGPLSVTGKLAGTYAPAERRLALDEIIVASGRHFLTGAASLLFTGNTPALYAALTSDALPVSDFKRIWPRFAAHGARRVVTGRFFGGMTRDLKLELRLPPGFLGSGAKPAKSQVSGGARFEGVRFDTIGDLPPVRDANGLVAFDGETLDVSITSGSTFLPSGRQVELGESRFLLPDHRLRPVPAQIDLNVSGEADAIAELASQRPVNAMAATGLSAEDVSGKASATARFNFLLPRRGEPASKPEFNVEVQLRDFALAKPLNGAVFSGANGTITTDGKELAVRLEGKLGDLPARIAIDGPQDAPEKQIRTATITLTDEARRRVAPALAAVLTGPVTATISQSGDATQVEADLTKASVRLPGFNWEKGAGVAAKADFKLVRDGSIQKINDLSVTGRGIAASGAMTIRNGSLQSARLRSVRLNPGDDFSVDVSRDGDVVIVELTGTQIDGRPLLRNVAPGRGEGAAAAPARIRLGGRVERLVGFGRETVLDADIGFNSGRSGAVSLSGSFASGGSIDLSRSSGAAGRFVIRSGNAGAALRFADLYSRMVGGTLAADFRLGEDGSLNGTASISDFTVIGETRLARLAEAKADGSSSLQEATQADLAGERSSFDLAQGDLTIGGGSISLKNGVIRGPNVGASIEGVVIDARGRMDLRGTFMPARGLNRIVGAIPLLGLLMGSGSRAGLIGITYQISGEARSPRVFVNPISIITPGVFRQIFE
jgi:hypothetical protein